MKKIIENLLTLKYPNMDIKALIEIIEATPNVLIATEILCGIYTEKVITDLEVVDEDDRTLTFVSYSKWIDELTFSYLYKETIGGYYLKGTSLNDITNENKESLVVSSQHEDRVWLHVPTGKTTKRTSTTTYAKWMNWSNDWKKANFID